ncbi:hypothetical protein Ddye_013784 [Dipteronia dyeriana]|uniref:B3 domain-containing protein n=1 Tax=Dipteronia dyeriana TaxID=168575 RepID=A0AAD9X717_9ROSI|nr:hypothetical protein Ddye_013784 [Dipteronia dyeriana]
MAPQNSQSVILFGRDIYLERREGGSSGGGGGQGCSSTSLQQQQQKSEKPEKEKEKSHINEGCSSMVVQNCVSIEHNNNNNNNNNNLTKQKRPVEDVVHDLDHDHQQRSDVTSELTQQQNHCNRDRDRIFVINKTRKMQHEASGASSSSSSKNTAQKFINDILKKNGVCSNSSNNSNQTVVVVVPRREQNLFVESSTIRTQQQQRLQRRRQVENMGLVAMRIRSFINYSPEEEEEERRRGVTTWLQLYSDPWKIKKKLRMSDLGGLSRFLIHANLVDNHVKPFMVKAGLFDQVETMDGLRVFVWDVETESEHKMVFKKWNSSGSFILIGSWCPEFVHRRSLKEGDEVGFLWDPYSSRFLFRVLSRAPNPYPNPIY